MSIRESAVTLKLPFIKNNYEECIREAHLNDWDHEQFLDALLKNEIEMRKQNAVKTKIRAARFPYQMILWMTTKENICQ